MPQIYSSPRRTGATIALLVAFALIAQLFVLASAALAACTTTLVSPGVYNHEGTSGADTCAGSGVVDFMYGHEGNDFLYALGGDDEVNGGANNDDLRGEGGVDEHNDAYGGGDTDRQCGGQDNDFFDVQDGDGNDTVWPGPGVYFANVDPSSNDDVKGTGASCPF